MRLIIVSVFAALISLQASSMSQRIIYDYDHYLILSERYFDMQNFDSCLHYNYILAHYYTQNKDTVGIVNTWYHIGIINLLQNKPTRAQAALIIAKRYITNRTDVNKELKIIFYNLSSKALPEFRTPAGLSSGYMRKLSYLAQLYKAIFDLQNNQFNNTVKTSLQQLICNMTIQADTNWFGYAKANMLMGEIFYNTDDYIKCIPYYESAINTLEKLRKINVDWVNSYRCFLSALYNTGQKEKQDASFKRIEKNNLIKKRRYSYYFIKGEYLRFTFVKEALAAYLQAYYTVDTLFDDRNALNLKIFYYYANSGQYDSAKVWLKKLDQNDMNDFDMIRTAYSCAKIRDIVIGDRLAKKVELKKFWYSKEILYWLGRYYFIKNDYTKSENYHNLYIHCLLSTNYDYFYDKLMSYSDLGYCYWYDKAEYKKSLECYHKAVYAVTRTNAPADYYQIPDINHSFSDKNLARELANKAECFYEISHMRNTKADTIRDLKASLNNLELSMIVAHRYKMSLSSDEQRYQYADCFQYRYPYIVKVCLELYRQTGDPTYANKAFDHSEKSKSSMLLST